MKAEIERRQSNTEKVLALFFAHPKQWMRATLFMDIGGLLAWRTRIADARKIVAKEGGTIENRQVRCEDAYGVTYHRSEYRYLPYVPLARSADVPPPDQPALFDLGAR